MGCATQSFGPLPGLVGRIQLDRLQLRRRLNARQCVPETDIIILLGRAHFLPKVGYVTHGIYIHRRVVGVT